MTSPSTAVQKEKLPSEILLPSLLQPKFVVKFKLNK